MANDPLQQFQISRLLPMEAGGYDISFTNSSLFAQASSPRVNNEKPTKATGQVKRIHPHALKLILQGKEDEAIAYLESTGQMDNTVIVYTGDQGFMLGEHDYMDKRWMYEESLRMPFLIRYPKSIKAGTRSDAIVENVDYGPTLLAFAGVDTPQVMQGKSFRSICETGEEPDGWKQESYYRYWMHLAHHDNPGHLGIRTNDYKLLFY